MWAEYNERYPNQKLGYYLGIYAMLAGVAFVFLIVSCWYVWPSIIDAQSTDSNTRQLIITMVPRSGVQFHKRLLETVLR